MSNCVAMHLGMQKVKNAFATTTTTTTTTPTPTSSSHAPLVPSAAKHHKVCDTTRVTPTTTSVKRSLSARGCRSSKTAEAMEGVITRTPAAGPGGEGLLSKLCRKLRTKPKRLERCEKCGQKSDTCLPNPSFISGRKHFLCQDCRASSDNMKNMYSQLYRNLSLREARNAATSSSASSGCGGSGGGSGGGGHSSGGDVTPPSSSSASTRVLRSRSMRTRPTCGPESGYETATSLDSTCSTGGCGGGGGNGRLSPDPLSTSSGGEYGGRCISPADDQLCSSSSCCGGGGSSFSPPPPPPPSATTGGRVPCLGDACSRDKAAVCSSTHVNNNNNKCEVFGGAFKSEKDHLRQIQPRPKPKVYTRAHTQQQQQQQNNVPTVPPPSYHQHQQQQQQQQQHKAQQQHTRPQQQKDSPARYDGYLEIRTPNSHGVKYVFRQAEQRREGEEEGDRLAALNDEVQAEHLSRRRHTENLKMCYHCRNYRCVAFRAPFGNGWLCEECMDDLL